MDTVRIGIIGAAGRGGIARHWHQPGGRSEVIAAADVSEKSGFDMIVDGKRPVATPLAGRMSVAVGCSATWSIRNGWQPVDIPPVPEEIRGKVF